jgi:hypothetical protein
VQPELAHFGLQPVSVPKSTINKAASKFDFSSVQIGAELKPASTINNTFIVNNYNQLPIYVPTSPIAAR